MPGSPDSETDQKPEHPAGPEDPAAGSTAGDRPLIGVSYLGETQ